ncbi:hypothetical protein MTO96_050520 [Rhipicephalus appendiculatus]
MRKTGPPGRRLPGAGRCDLQKLRGGISVQGSRVHPPSVSYVEGLTLQRTGYASSNSKYHMWFAEEDANVNAPSTLRRPALTNCGATAHRRREGVPDNERHGHHPEAVAPAPGGARDPRTHLPFDYKRRPPGILAGLTVSRERHLR